MALCKRPAADLDAGQAVQETCCCKRRRLRIGSTADYDEMCCLGEGSFGFVVKARHRATGKIVAIKALRSPDEINGEPAAAANELLHEARFLEAASAGNPYVVASHGLVRDLPTKNLCLAMEYVGPSLHAFLHKSPRLPESTVRSFMFQLLTGAEKMHQRNIVHRDIKPANILVGEDGKMVKMCDLGLAMSLTTQPPLYTEAGTLPYMAPEMLLGKPDYDARVDTWSLGCVMAELITGETLFKEGRDETGQLLDIFHVLGSLDEKTWPEFASLPRAAMLQLLLELEEREGRQQHKRTLGDFFSEEMLSDEGFQVLEGLLTCNPDKRLTAAAALKLPWFAPPTVKPIKIFPPATPAKTKEPPKKKNVVLIKRNIPLRAIPKTKKKNVLRVSLAMWKKAQINSIPPPAALKNKKNALRIPLVMWNKAQLV